MLSNRTPRDDLYLEMVKDRNRDAYQEAISIYQMFADDERFLSMAKKLAPDKLEHAKQVSKTQRLDEARKQFHFHYRTGMPLEGGGNLTAKQRLILKTVIDLITGRLNLEDIR